MPAVDALSHLIDELKQSGFQGDIESSYAERIVAATDNSIYQLTPQAILYPRVLDDINLAMACVFKHHQHGFSLCARGGGTGTNGQSLSDNLILDCARYLNRIVDFDAEKLTVMVQPGVVLDQLNEFLKPHGLFFPIDISSSSRATLGGMVATDASGQGSLIYGKTSSHLAALDLVLSDGSDFHVHNMPLDKLDQYDPFYSTVLGPIYRQLDNQREEIDRVFPVMNRGLTGYNLQQCIAEPGHFNPCYLIAGSEGTLAITRQITLRVIPRPRHKMLTVIFYEDFQLGLEHVQTLLKSNPAAIEMLDDKVLGRARNDAVWFDVQSILDGLPADKLIGAANFVEHVAQTTQEMAEQQLAIHNILRESADRYSVIVSRTETDSDKINALWSLRKRAVGLLGQMQDGKRGIAFVEDTAVPPQNLSAYVSGFRQLLDENRLEYGMYGHADAGVLHVRPLLDMLQAHDRQLIRAISDKVAKLAKQHGGVLWGEHGRGFRGEYTPLFFGETLYPLLCEIKKYFDPNNLLNPGKLTTPHSDQPVIALDAITLRGELDAQISDAQQQTYADTLACNGNGACLNWQPKEAMCPSYKATRNKLYSPKGRAAMLREWARLNSMDSSNPALAELEQALFNSLQHCLSCKSCTSSCPLKVDIPELKSQFLHSWYQHHPRAASSFFTRHFETLIALGAKFPRITNTLIRHAQGEKLLQRISRLGRLPEFSSAQYQHAIVLDDTSIKQLKSHGNAVILLRDNYMQSFDRETLQACCHVLHSMGLRVYLSPLIHNGKLLHVKGYRNEFKQQARKVTQQLERLADTGLALISCETVTRLLFDMEYADILQQENRFNIRSIESFLLDLLKQTTRLPKVNNLQAVTLLPHCLEQTRAQQSSQHWQAVFDKLGIDLTIINAGCCGMSGLFGHEIENHRLSDDIFRLAWKPALQSKNKVLLATGFSCRCQSKNHQFDTLHPIVHLASVL